MFFPSVRKKVGLPHQGVSKMASFQTLWIMDVEREMDAEAGLVLKASSLGKAVLQVR